MNQTVVRGLIISVGILDLAVSGFFTYASWTRSQALPELPREVASVKDADSQGGAADTGASKLRSWVTLDEMYVNVLSEAEEVHTLGFKLEVELFDEGSRRVMEERQALVKNAIIEVARNQHYEALGTLAGKLYFKEALVGRVNETVKFPLIRDVHLSSFALR